MPKWCCWNWWTAARSSAGLMPRYRATVAYDGASYFGFQRQAGETPTIQAALELAIAGVCGQRVVVSAAGRTDTGVHALGQVIAFDCDWPHHDLALLQAINAKLPEDIALQELAQQAGFHPRFAAESRRYRYQVAELSQRQPLLKGQCWQIIGQLDLGAMQTAAALLVGEHDFGAFGRAPKGTNTVRRVMISQWEANPVLSARMLTYTVEATAFLHHMVRRMVAVMVAIGRGQRTVQEFEAIFRTADRSKVRKIAPPQGLILEAVRYKDHTASVPSETVGTHSEIDGRKNSRQSITEEPKL